MKTVTIQQVPRDWAEILRWVVGGKEVQLTDQDKVVARLLPPEKSDAPDFVARAKAVWGDRPEGESLSELVSKSRRGDS
jgi:antitoxin (DNA-binding transcriptional repressor) of toxin-antitoxin stability system